MSTGTANRAVSGTQSGPRCMLKQPPSPGNVRHSRPARRSRCSPSCINPLVSTMMTCNTRTAERHPDDALSCRKRPYAFSIDMDSDPEQPEAQCAKTYEIRRTPTPVRVTEALQAAVLEGVARPARARAGLLLAWDLKYRSRPHHNRRGAAPGGHRRGKRVNPFRYAVAYLQRAPSWRLGSPKPSLAALFRAL